MLKTKIKSAKEGALKLGYVLLGVIIALSWGYATIEYKDLKADQKRAWEPIEVHQGITEEELNKKLEEIRKRDEQIENNIEAEQAKPLTNKDVVEKIGEATFGEGEVQALLELVQKESSFNHLAQNPTSTATGLFQFLDSTWSNYGCKKTTNVEKQVKCGVEYIKNRYETPSKALAFHKANGYY